MEIDGIGICSCYISGSALGRENWIKYSDKEGDGVSSPSCSQFSSHLREEKIDPQAPVSKVKNKVDFQKQACFSQDFHRQKGTLSAFSRG